MERAVKMLINILLVDDHTIVRSGLNQLIQLEDGMKVVGQAESGLEAIQLVRELSPDVVIMDISMSDINGIDATHTIIRDFRKVKVIALSMHSSKKFVREMFNAGASGYLLKTCKFDELVEAIHAVMSGKSYISPEISNVVLDNFVRNKTEEQALSKRERQVLQLLAEGNTTKQIGAKLYISPKTVEAHRLRVMEKLEIYNVAELTRYAIQEDLIALES